MKTFMSTATTGESRVCVVIVNYRTARLTIDCLRSLVGERAVLGGRMSVIVTDNLSPGDSVRRISEAVAENGWGEWVRVMPLPRNAGFAYGNNEAIRALMAEGELPDYVHLLNPDTVVYPGAVVELVKFMDAHPRVGIAGSRLENVDGSPQPSACRFHSLRGEINDGIRLGVVSKFLSKYEVAPPAPKETCEVDWVSGASFFVRSKVIEQIGLLDETYFMYYEETDFSLRAMRAGWERWYVTASRVTHLQGQATGGPAGKRVPSYYFDSRRWYFVKHHGRLVAALADLAWGVTYALWRVRRWVQRKRDNDPPCYLSDFVRNSVFARGFKCH